MNPRVAVVLVVLLAVIGGGALVYQYQDRARRPENVATLGRPLLKDLRVADVATIKISEPKATLTLQRKDDGWVVAERRGFPADVARVRELALKLIGLKIGQSELIGGKKYFKREVENPDKAPADGRFVALPAEAGTVYTISDPLTQVSAKSADWIERSSFQVEKVKTLEVRPPSGQGYRIERAKDDAGWKLAGLKPGEKLDVSRANSASYSLSLLELADVAPEDAKDTGLDQPTLINATTLDGLTYEIKVGSLAGDNYFVRFSSSGSAPEEAKGPDEERLKKLRERLPREKLLSDYVLLIPKSKLEDTLKPRAELLEKKNSGSGS